MSLNKYHKKIYSLSIENEAAEKYLLHLADSFQDKDSFIDSLLSMFGENFPVDEASIVSLQDDIDELEYDKQKICDERDEFEEQVRHLKTLIRTFLNERSEMEEEWVKDLKNKLEDFG